MSDKSKTASKIAIRTGALFAIALYGCIILIVDKLNKHKCPCIDEWRDDYAYYASMVLVGLHAVALFLGTRWYKPYCIVVCPFTMVTVVITATYFHKLKYDPKCDCSKQGKENCGACNEDNMRMVIRYVMYGFVCLYALAALVMVATILTMILK